MLILKAMPKDQSTRLRTHFVSTRLTSEERKRLRDEAAVAGLSPSKYLQNKLADTFGEPSDTRVILAYLELLTEDVARIETVIAYVVANLKVGNDLTASVVEQFAIAASKRKLGYAGARLEAAKLKAAKDSNHAK